MDLTKITNKAEMTPARMPIARPQATCALLTSENILVNLGELSWALALVLSQPFEADDQSVLAGR